jgi:peptide/nickel transport system substrate-binding protein
MRHVVRRSSVAMFVLAVVLVLGASACGSSKNGTGASPNTNNTTGTPAKGGDFHTEIDAFEWTGNFDPTGEYLGDAQGIFSNLLVRTLMGYNHLPDAAGNEVIPDLAADEPEISDGDTTYTFTLRDGVKFGPPVSRDVTSKDVEYAFRRIGTPSLVAQYGFYYLGVIKGLQAYNDAGGLTGKTPDAPIEGIETPDDKTIIFHLEKPTGDFLFRIAMPAAGPIPEEVAKCFTKAGEYGRFVISSGPYMIKGSDTLDATSCKTMKALQGFNPNTKLELVRNPNYDAATDTTKARENFFDTWEMTLNTNAQDIFDKVKAGTLDMGYAAEPAEVIREYTTNDSLKKYYHSNSGDRTWYITMNLTQPPFDDIHVRKAMNWIMDKEGLRRAWGGSPKGDIGTHIVPDTIFNGDLDDYNPYGTEGDAGDLAKAQEEMKQSKYDTNKDGMCDAPECKGILHVTRTTDVWRNMTPIIEAAAAKIGLQLVTRPSDDSYTIIQTINRKVPISSTPGWGKDYADASTFMVLFDSRSTAAEGNVNYSLVGLTADQAKTFKIDGTTTGIPSVDADIDACNVKLGDERLTCWEDLDKKLMETVVPWVPYLYANADYIVSDKVTKYEFDQAFTTPAWAHIAVSN